MDTPSTHLLALGHAGPKGTIPVISYNGNALRMRGVLPDINVRATMLVMERSVLARGTSRLLLIGGWSMREKRFSGDIICVDVVLDAAVPSESYIIRMLDMGCSLAAPRCDALCVYHHNMIEVIGGQGEAAPLCNERIDLVGLTSTTWIADIPRCDGSYVNDSITSITATGGRCNWERRLLPPGKAPPSAEDVFFPLMRDGKFALVHKSAGVGGLSLLTFAEGGFIPSSTTYIHIHVSRTLDLEGVVYRDGILCTALRDDSDNWYVFEADVSAYGICGHRPEHSARIAAVMHVDEHSTECTHCMTSRCAVFTSPTVGLPLAESMFLL